MWMKMDVLQDKDNSVSIIYRTHPAVQEFGAYALLRGKKHD
jgi:hypothetical protein